jgi:hypothetical protein
MVELVKVQSKKAATNPARLTTRRRSSALIRCGFTLVLILCWLVGAGDAGLLTCNRRVRRMQELFKEFSESGQKREGSTVYGQGAAVNLPAVRNGR